MYNPVFNIPHPSPVIFFPCIIFLMHFYFGRQHSLHTCQSIDNTLHIKYSSTVASCADNYKSVAKMAKLGFNFSFVFLALFLFTRSVIHCSFIFLYMNIIYYMKLLFTIPFPFFLDWDYFSCLYLSKLQY